MGENISDTVKDAAPNDIKGNVDIYHVCSAEPANYAEIAAVSLGSVAIDSSDFTVGDGDASGLKIAVGSQ